MALEYGKWPESKWASDSASTQKKENVAIGVDVGTTSTQAAVIADGVLIAFSSIRTGADFAQSAKLAIEMAIENLGLAKDAIKGFGSTGFGKSHVVGAKAVDDVSAHAKGARFIYGPEVTTVVDMGAQTCRAILLYDWDRVRDFAMNDICATGMGRNIEMMCDLMHVPITEIGELSLNVSGADDPEPVSTTCYAYADTETLGLLRPEYRADPLSPNEVYASHLFSLAWRMLGTIGKLQSLDVGDVKVEGKLGFTGGLARNPGITKRVERDLQTTALTSDIDPMLAGAIGSALLALE